MHDKLKALLRTGNEPPIAAVIRPFQKFFEIEEAGGILLIACSVVAMIWANSPWSQSYIDLWHTEVGFSVGVLELKKSLLHWINDGLMALFFFFVGLEIKREVLHGELSSFRKAALPLAAALGGMIVPALIYTAFNSGGEGARGWGIPMATDIAFALGILGLLGKRIPLGLTVFLAALAIADDIGAVIVIAVFYNAAITWQPLIMSSAIIVLLVLANRSGVRNPLAYLIMGIAAWLFVMQSGIHASIAGVLVAMTIPARTRINSRQFVDYGRVLLNRYANNISDISSSASNKQRASVSDDQDAIVHSLETVAERVQTPLGRMEHELYPWVSFFIMPVFALANAGILFGPDAIDALLTPVTIGVAFGLLFGKTIGITLFAWLAVKLGVASLPESVSWKQMHGAAWLGGIGFTMSIFITTLAFDSDALEMAAKAGVLLGSVAAGTIGWAILRHKSEG